MIKIENTQVVGWEAAVRGMRNPMNSWDQSDSRMVNCGYDGWEKAFVVGANDLDLMNRLRNAGTDHRKFMRMITVYVDLTAPFYWWKEFDTYKVGTVANSCSTMHKIQSKKFTLDDFSHEHLDQFGISCLEMIIQNLNANRNYFNDSKNKDYWWQMIQLLPTSYNQKRTVMLNYEVLANIYKSRKAHKLDEWHDLCHWVEGLPYSELITG